MHPKLGHGPPPLHEVERHGGQCVPLSSLSKAEDVKVPVVLSILHLTRPPVDTATDRKPRFDTATDEQPAVNTAAIWRLSWVVRGLSVASAQLDGVYC